MEDFGFEHYEADGIEAEVRRSLFPTLWCCRAALPHMVERGAGVIVNVSSIATRSHNRVPYAASKGGVNALTASLAFEANDRRSPAGTQKKRTTPGGSGVVRFCFGAELFRR
jgi:dihydroxycyclohexadiene carboxylate dehydrogenase